MARDAAHAPPRRALTARQAVQVAVIVNRAAGRRASAARASRRIALTHAVLGHAGVDYEVFATERPGHAPDLARRAVNAGARLVIAWGGDGTLNEVGSALAFTGVALGIVRGGSGNGLARALGIPSNPAAALRHALTAGERCIDAGDISGRLFFNLAGFGFDAHVAELFARSRSRGLRGYAAIVARELFSFQPPRLRVEQGGRVVEQRVLLLVVANGTQWGQNARIAPYARLDDGLLDIVAVAPRSPLGIATQIHRLFRGCIDRVPNVSMDRAAAIRVSGRPPLQFHVDGEPAAAPGGDVAITVHPGALRVRA